MAPLALLTPLFTGMVASSGGPGRWLLDAALNSPLYKAVLVPQAKGTMVKTAEANGVPWRDALAWIRSQEPWKIADGPDEEVAVPDYYRQPFHAYEDGNLCWDAAWEGEIASRAVGARNFPDFGADGEAAFRGAFDEALLSIGAECPAGGTMVDFGCGSGVSTRRLATGFPQASSIVGLDLSPHFLAVGRRLLELAPDGGGETNKPWVNNIVRDPRVSLRRADIAASGLADGSVDVVCLSLVIHELPAEATRAVCAEAFRVLKPGSGQLWLTEMDFDTDGFSKLRANPLLFSLIRSTEPYLDVYADYQTSGGLTRDLAEIGYGSIRLTAATGRHFALVATKPGQPKNAAQATIDDRRAEMAKPDTHLKTWQAKRERE
jgi:SAM-dependent methyltransferase